MDSLKEEDKKIFLGELMKYSLNEKGVLNVKHNSIIEFAWDKIIEDLENKSMAKKKFKRIFKDKKNGR